MSGSPDLASGSSSHDPKATINDLGDLPLLEVFGKLDTVSKAHVAGVCKRWRDIVYSPALWKHTTVCLDVDSLSSADLDSLRRRGIRIVSISEYIDGKKLTMLIYGLPSLETLDMSHVMMTKERLAVAFPRVLTQVKMLVMQLDVLDVETIGHVAHTFQNLSDLRVFCDGIDKSFSGPDQPPMMPCLTSLKITCVCVLTDDQVLCNLCWAFPNLKELTTSLSGTVTEGGMQYFYQMKEIRSLKLQCSAFPLLCSTQTAKLQNLHVLKVPDSDPTDQQLDDLAKLPELEELHIGCRNVSEDGWGALSRGFRKLKYLSLHRPHFSENTEVQHFESLLLLQKIVFMSLKATDLQLKSLCSALRHVQSMTILFGPGTNNDYMEAISDMENLNELCLGCTSISDKELKQLARTKAPLKRLTMDNRNISGDGLLHFAQQKKSLTVLRLSAAIEIDKLCQIVNELPDLQELFANVTAVAKERLQQLKPGLVVR